MTGCADVEPRPHVILIVIDTLRADAIHDPYDLVDTPHIDALAADGVVFSNAFAHAPMTLPSHTSLFSSRLPFETGVLNNGQVVPEDLPLLAERLEEYGYRTCAVISLGTLSLVGQEGIRRGFEEFNADFMRMAKAHEVTERVSDQLGDLDPDQPVFLFVHYSDPHEPYYDHDHEPRNAELWIDGELFEEICISDAYVWKGEIELEPG